MSIFKSLIGSRSSKAVYGLILITVVLIGLERHATDSMEVALKVLLAAIAIVIAEIYSEYLGEKIKRKKALSKREHKEISHDASAIFAVSLYPALIFLISALGLYSIEVAFKIAYTLSLIGLGAFGYIASMYAGDPRSTSIKRTLLAVFIGFAVILLKYELGH